MLFALVLGTFIGLACVVLIQQLVTGVFAGPLEADKRLRLPGPVVARPGPSAIDVAGLQRRVERSRSRPAA